MWSQAGSAMVLIRGESPTTHRNQMKNIGLVVIGLITLTMVTGCDSSKSTHSIVPVILSENMQKHAVDKFAYAHCINGARGLSYSYSGNYIPRDLSASVKEIISACSSLK